MAQGEQTSPTAIAPNGIGPGSRTYDDGTSHIRRVVGDGEYPPSNRGNARCTKINRAQRRCARYAQPGSHFCFNHRASQQAILTNSARYSDALKDKPKLRDAYLAHLDDPDICDIRPELAFSRAMLESVMRRAKDKEGGLGALSAEAMATIAALTARTAALAEQTDRILTRASNSVTLVQLDAFIDQLIAIISDRITDHDTLADIAHALEECALPSRRDTTPSEHPIAGRYLRAAGDAVRKGARTGGPGAVQQDCEPADRGDGQAQGTGGVTDEPGCEGDVGGHHPGSDGGRGADADVALLARVAERERDALEERATAAVPRPAALEDEQPSCALPALARRVRRKRIEGSAK